MDKDNGTTEDWWGIIYNLVLNGHKMTPKLQNAIADYISYRATPTISFDEIIKESK